MREMEYKARDKVVQKMTRDGLSERNLSEDTERRVSRRQEDFAFRQAGDSGMGETAGEPGSDSPTAGTAADARRAGKSAEAQADGREHDRTGADRGQTARGMDAQRKRRMQRGNAEAWRERKAGDDRSAPGVEDDPGRREERADTGSHGQENGDCSARDTNHFTDGADHSTRHTSRSAKDIGGSSKDAARSPKAAGRGRESAGAEGAAPHGSEAGKAKRRTDAASRKYRKAEKRLGTAERELERARAKLPTRRRLKLEAAGDGSMGRRKSRLRFEKEVIPENESPSLLKRTGGTIVHTAQLAASTTAHQKIREAGQGNVGVESAHKAGILAERAAGRAYRTARERLRSRPYRAARRAEEKTIAAGGDAAYRKFLMENPEIRKKTLAKWTQKQRIKRKYAAEAGKAARGAGRTAGAASTGKAVMGAAGSPGKSRAVLVVIAALILAFILSGSLFTSCSSMFMGMGSAVTAACYLAEETDICQGELRYTELETDLQLDIKNTESSHPGYDEYRYNIGEIGHNPYELMGYLSAAFDAFTYAQVEAELYRLFGLQYELTREEVTEVRTYLDEEGEEQEYDWHILRTVLTVRPLSGILSASLATADQAERYGIYMLTCGGRQNFGSPFDFPWLGYVTSPYGYRVHPISGDRDLHRGVDIAAAEGTPILAVQDGRVVSAGDAGGYGLCLVIKGEDGYQSRYAHCSAILVNAGQEVRQGDMVARVGNTGDSTGPHLHLETVHGGEYLNPYYFVENGGDGFTADGNAAGRPQFAADPGEPMGDGTFGAMLEVAERYIGYPYVWGGSSPETSFDCSGYASYVINASGAGSVGRQTAQGLCNLCTPISWEDLRPGDLVFFTGTYSSMTPVSHVGIYVGGGRMISAGDPIGYADIESSRYWRSHFYCGGRLP